MSQDLNDTNVQAKSNSIPLLELDTSPIKNTETNNPPKSPSIICPLYRRKRLAFYPMKNNEKKGM